MSKIIPFDIFKERSEEQFVPEEPSKPGFIRNIIEIIKDFMDLCRLQSDEYEDLYDDYYDK